MSVKPNPRDTSRGAGNARATNPTPNILDGLYGADIKTNVQDISFHVIQNGKVLNHSMIRNVSAYETAGKTMTLKSNDGTQLFFNFISSSEATLGETRIRAIINGGLLA